MKSLIKEEVPKIQRLYKLYLGLCVSFCIQKELTREASTWIRGFYSLFNNKCDFFNKTENLFLINMMFDLYIVIRVKAMQGVAHCPWTVLYYTLKSLYVVKTCRGKHDFMNEYKPTT